MRTARAAAPRAPVQRTAELERVLRLPRRPPDPSLVPDLTPVFAREGGTMRLWSIQSWALWEAERSGGLFAPISCGRGKTLVSLILPEVLQARLAVLLIPPQLRDQLLEHDLEFYGRHFVLPLERLRIVAYSELSLASKVDILERLGPDLIVADEAHALARRTESARARRVAAYLRNRPETRFVALSGTMTRRSILDYAHMLGYALREGSPLPLVESDLADWAAALDADPDRPAPPGALRRLCHALEGDVRYEVGGKVNVGGVAVVRRGVITEADPGLAWARGSTVASLEASGLVGAVEPSAMAVREAYRQRLVETPGVVSSPDDELGCSLYLERADPELPLFLSAEITTVRQTFQIGEEELASPADMVRVCRQLASGFHYVWRWPGGVKDEEWLGARAAWHRRVRHVLAEGIEGLDSPLLVARRAQAGTIYAPEWPAWDAVRGRPHPPVEPVWSSDFMVRFAIRWARETCSPAYPGIIWYESVALGERIAAEGSLPWYGAGERASSGLLGADPRREPAIVCSISAHSTGKNLQGWSSALVLEPPASGAAWEQLCSRQHRPGQQADEVRFELCLHTKELSDAFAKAQADAAYIQETTGQRQRLCYAQRVGV